jgi:hypothetical protein
MLNFPINHPYWYFFIAIVTSIYYGSRGPFIQIQNQKSKENQKKRWSGFKLVYVLCIQDFFFNFVCSFAGFISLYLLRIMVLSLGDISKIAAGTGILMVFLALVAISGISGQLPSMLARGRFPKS